MAKGKAEELDLENDPNVFLDVGQFTLPNGDRYSGGYVAHRVGLIWREGRGIYTTKDGQTYEGDWHDDKLREETEVTITYPSGEAYRGCTLEEKYHGPGHYTMDNKMDISCEFVENKPTGNVILIDINGRMWEGAVTEGATQVLLLPENHFYFALRDGQGVGKPKSRQAEEQPVQAESKESSRESSVAHRDWEKMIFKKSAKTANDVDFSQWKWCQRYLRFKKIKTKISDKLQADPHEELDEEEKKWRGKYEKYRSTRRRQKKAAEAQKQEALSHVPSSSVLDEYYSKKYMEKCVAIKVFRPSCDQDLVQEVKGETRETLGEASKKSA